MNKTFCDICGEELEEEVGFGKFKHEGINPYSFKENWDLCEEHSLQVFEFIYKMKLHKGENINVPKENN